MSDVFSRLEERQQARLAALEQRKKEEQEGKRVEETSEYFKQQFDQNKTGKATFRTSCLLCIIFSYNLHSYFSTARRSWQSFQGWNPPSLWEDILRVPGHSEAIVGFNSLPIWLWQEDFPWGKGPPCVFQEKVVWSHSLVNFICFVKWVGRSHY